ncbi:bromodomain adjacent to zinc finger domain protein 2B-like [Babylonia areolata]|uniref:bromodomain adjacent to zinc finger domain protein 2B-like n=1 Tax=Babylonia areolata TaxID=304850 RepID=UPI003FD3C03C
MSKEDKPPPSPNHGLFDPAHLFGAPSLGLAAAGLPFPHLAHLPAYPWLARPAFPPALFGGLGALPSPLLAHGLPHSSAADFGELSSSCGAEWWRAASEHAQRGDLFVPNLGAPIMPSLGTLGLESNTPGLEFLLTAPSEGDKSALFNMSKHLSELPSTSTSSTSKRSRTPTPAPAHQKSSSKSTTSTSSSSSAATASSKDLHLSYPPFSLDGKNAWHLNGSAFSLSSLMPAKPEGSSGSRKRRHKEDGGSSSRESKAAKTSSSSSSSLLSVLPAHSSRTGGGGGSSRKEVREERVVEENGVLNLSKSAAPPPSATVTSPLPPPPVTPGVEDLSLKKSDKESRTTTNGTTLSDSVSADASSAGSDSDNSDVGNQSESDKDKVPAHHIDGSRKQLLADQIRQHILADTLSPSPSHQSTPLVIPSLRGRHGKEESEGKKSAHTVPPLSLVNFVHDYHRPESLLLERDLLGLPSTSAALHSTSPHVAAAFSFLPAELRPNHHSKEESQDSLLSLHTSEADDKPTSGSERLMDSESPSGWGSEDDASRNQASSSASPGPSYSEDPSKKRNIVLNEKELLIPLEHGWRRQTTIHGMGRRGIVGEVLYFAPCNKKMKTIPDVMRYLDRHAITDLSRENFTFNTKVNVGQFYEIRDKQVVRLSEVEILERIAMSKGKRARMQMLAKKKCEKQLRQQALAKQLMEAKFKKRQEQQEMARKAAEMRYQMRLEKEQQKEMAKKAKQVRLIERQREKERSRIMKQQEKIRLQEQLRVEREMKAQQILEARRRRQAELEEMRLKEIARKNQEREMKKQQQIMEKEQEKERRRQHFLLVKALEQRKKEEERLERERQREEKIRKQNIERERKLAQRQIEMLIAREMKKPMDDMELRNGKPLPKFPRCAEAKLPGPAFSDALMVVEFVHNFADALGLDSESLPSLEVFQNGLMNTNEEDVEEVVTLYLHLLRFALDDLGVPNPKSAMTALNQKITDLEITDATMSEVTRLFLFAHGEKEMSQWLEEIPLEALNATKKAAIIAFLCNELLSSKRLSGEIERTLESINTLRRDKWIVEGKLRKLRTVRARKYLKLELMGPAPQPVADDDSMTNTTTTSSKPVSDEEEEEEEKEEEKEEEEELESFDDNSTTGNRSEDEDEALTKEEMDKKIDKLAKQHNSFDSRVADVSKQLRGTCLGQDRFKRFYWILPYTGGIFVEGIESGDTEALPFEAELLAKQKAKEEEEEKQRAEAEALKKEEKPEGEATQTAAQGADKATDSVKEDEKVTEVKSILDPPVTVKEEVCEQATSDQSGSIPKESVGEGSVCVTVSSAASEEGGSVVQVQPPKTVNASTQENSVDVSIVARSVVPAVLQDRGTTTEIPSVITIPDLAKKGNAAGSVSAHQEPILYKLNDLLRLPHLRGLQSKADPTLLSPVTPAKLDNDGAGTPAATVVSAAAVSSAPSSTVSSTLLSPSSSISAPSAVTLTMSSLSSILTVATATTVSSTPSYPSPLLTSLSSSSASSTLSSLAAAAATGSNDASLLGPMMSAPPTAAHTVSTPSTPVSSLLSVSVTSATSMADGVSKVMPVPSVLSPLKASASKSLLTVSLLSPEFSTSAMATKPDAHSPNLSVASTSKPCVLSPTVRKTMSSTATTILSSTPLSMLAAMSKATTLSPSSNTASVSAENGPLLQLSSTPVATLSSSLLATSRTVSLLNSTPVTSPIPSLSSSPVKDKKSNFVSIDALLQKDPQGSPSPSPSSSTATATVSTSTSTPVSASGNNNKHFLNPSLFPPSPLITDHHLKSYVDILDQKPWFSILPRIPCDDVGLNLPKVAAAAAATTTSTSVPGLGMVSSDNIASASLSLLSLLPMQHQVLQEQKATSATQSQTSPAHTQTESQTKSMLDFTSAFQAHLSQSGLEDVSMTVSTATNTSDLSLCTDSFKVPAPPSDSSYLSTEILLDFDPTAQLMKIQGECLPIPLSKQRGWWKIEDAQQARQLFTSMLSRGIREKNLSHMLRKHMDFICNHLCKIDTGKIIKQEIEEKASTQTQTQPPTPPPPTPPPPPPPPSEEISDPSSTAGNKVTKATETEDPSFLVKKEIKTEVVNVTETPDHNAGAAVKKEKEEEREEEEEDDAIPKEAEDSWSVRVEFEVEMACLEDVEALEDRIFNASLQVKVWKLPQRASEDPEIHMVDRSVEDPQPPNFYPMDVARQRLLLLESNVERRYLKPPLIRNVQLNLATLGTDRSYDSRHSEKSSGDGKSQDDEDEAGSEAPSVENNEDVPPGLMLWRRAVRTARTPAQLNLCTQLLGNSIAWEKSIMKVTCQICMKDDNEAELLLCDGCDKGYHTYCFKPKMDNIPDGDWYCYECVSKVSGKSHCIVCGGQGGKMVECERCPRAIHTDCLDPPLPRMPKKWQCAICVQTKSKKSCKRKRKEPPPPQASPLPSSGRERKDSATVTTRDRRASETIAEPPTPSPEKKKKEAAKEKNVKPVKEEKKKEEKVKEDKKKAEKPKKKVEEKEKSEPKEKKPKEKKSKKKKDEEAALLDPTDKHPDIVLCAQLLLDLEKSEDGWPFLRPVSTKQFPSYRRYIKQPMDFTTMKHKLRDNVYKERSEVASDLKLIWTNCETFNEDDSEVGQAGHNLHRLFQEKWKELFPDDAL